VKAAVEAVEAVLEVSRLVVGMIEEIDVSKLEVVEMVDDKTDVSWLAVVEVAEEVADCVEDSWPRHSL